MRNLISYQLHFCMPQMIHDWMHKHEVLSSNAFTNIEFYNDLVPMSHRSRSPKSHTGCFYQFKVWFVFYSYTIARMQLNSCYNWQCHLVAITGTTSLVPSPLIKSPVKVPMSHRSRSPKSHQGCFYQFKVWFVFYSYSTAHMQLNSCYNWQCHLVAITGTTSLVPSPLIKSPVKFLQLIWDQSSNVQQTWLHDRVCQDMLMD